MNKHLLSFLLVPALALTASAQIFSEDFDNIPGPTAGGAGTYVFPAGWMLRNVDNGTPAASVSYVNEAWERREDFGGSVTDSVAFSTSWYTPAGTSNDFMWTPLVGPIPANTVLTWNAKAYDPMYPDGYEVRIMTSSQGPPTGGTGVIGNQLTNSTSVFSVAAEATTWTAHSINLSAYTGQSIYIGFRNTATDKFLLVIDDVVVAVQVNDDAALTSIDTAEYTIEPKTQVTPDVIRGTVHNDGLNALTNIQLKLNVYDGTLTQVYTSSSASLASLAANASALLTVGSYTPPAIPDLYTYEYVVTHSGPDQISTNDTMYRYVQVDDSVYARDDGTVVGGLGIGAGNGGYLGQQYDVVNIGKLTSVGVYYTRGYTGRKAGLAVWNMAAGVPNAIVAVTDTIHYPDDSARFYVIPMHGGPVTLTPGLYAVTAIEFDSTLSLGQTTDIFTLGTTWVNWPTNPTGGWANNEDFGSTFMKPYVIRPNFVDVCSGYTALADSVNASCATCADGSTTVTTSNGVGPYTYLWMPGGSTAQNPGGLLPGTYTVTVTDANGCTATDVVDVSFSTQVNAVVTALSIQVVPNPSNEKFNLNFSLPETSDMHISLLNVLGEEIFVKDLSAQRSGNVEIMTSQLADGIYSLHITAGKEMKVIPVIVKH